MESVVDSSMFAFKRFDSRNPVLVRKFVQCRSRNMIVNPIDWTSIASPRICFQVVNANAPRWPVCNSRIAIIYPNLAALAACWGQVGGHHEGLLMRDRVGL